MERFRKGKFYGILYEKGVLYFLLSFLIPFAIIVYAFGYYGIHPFGDRQILVVDLWHQYYPFFRVVREKLMHGGSFLYSWENGMGTNFLSLISYYAASPLNWLSVFFRDGYERDALTFILAAKIGFAGAFFSATFSLDDLVFVFVSSIGGALMISVLVGPPLGATDGETSTISSSAVGASDPSSGLDLLKNDDNLMKFGPLSCGYPTYD